MAFPKDFIWGAASSSYQIEGGGLADGKGLNIWDVFCEKEGKIANGDTGMVSTDHYHRYKEDVALMKSMGLTGYRLSISWPRVLPDGTGKVNEAGMAFYENLIDELLAAGITPFVTLFHWDLPYALYLRGGWLNEDITNWYADYATLIMERLSDRVSNWFTTNEPNVVVGQGHFTGRSAPGITLQRPELFRVMKHLIVSHGKAVQAIRASAKTPARISYVAGLHGMVPENEDNPADVAATRAAYMKAGNPDSPTGDIWWKEMCFNGRIPEGGEKLFTPGIFEVTDEDLKNTHQELDYYGGNLYYGQYIKAGPDGEPVRLPRKPGFDQTGRNWPIVPRAMYWGPKFFHEKHPDIPIIVSENGMSNADYVSSDGKCHDPQRVEFLKQYLTNLKRAVDEGVPVLGYMHWSILDSMEWMFGYNYRFGLIHTDFETFKRTPKDSAEYYSKVIASNGECLSD